MPSRCFTGIALAGSLALSSCGAARPSKYYALESVPPQASAPGSVSVSLLVGRLSAPHVFRDDRIVYRTGSSQMGTYEYHRWAEPPTDMLEAMLVRTLRASGRYASVQSLRSNARGDYILRGRLNDLEEVSGSPVIARFGLEVELYEVKSGTVVWSHSYQSDEALQGKEVSNLVEALNRNVQRGLAQIVAGLDQYFASRPPK